MSQKHDNHEQTEKKSDKCFSKIPDCCSTDMGEMMSKGCPFKMVIKRHRAAVYAGLAGVGLVLLTIPIGAVLGIIAFFRTF